MKSGMIKDAVKSKPRSMAKVLLADHTVKTTTMKGPPFIALSEIVLLAWEAKLMLPEKNFVMKKNLAHIGREGSSMASTAKFQAEDKAEGDLSFLLDSIPSLFPSKMCSSPASAGSNCQPEDFCFGI
uniref:Uncharacterized protein n=1 Tax=Sphaerodactylus townsendi TaxID=933632 RepID=A0ACB8FNP9_9SAUR